MTRPAGAVARDVITCAAVSWCGFTPAPRLVAALDEAVPYALDLPHNSHAPTYGRLGPTGRAMVVKWARHAYRRPGDHR